MRIQAVTPSFTTRTQPIQNNAKVITRPIEKPIKQIDVQTPVAQKMEFNWFPSIFSSKTSKDMDEIKSIKNDEGFQRYDKEDQKEIKKYLKKGELDVDTVKTFAQTNLTIKGMSEAYQFSKTTKDPKAEQQNILKAVVEFEKPEMKMPQQYKEYRTDLKRSFDKNYKIINHDGTHTAYYKEGGKKTSECRAEAGPYHPSPKSSDADYNSSSSTDTNTNQRHDDWTDPLNPFSPMSPLNPLNPIHW